MSAGERGCCHAGAPFAPADATAHYPPDQRVTLLHLDLALRIDLEAESLDGEVTYRLRGREGAHELSLDAVELELRHVSGAEHHYDGRRIRLGFSPAFAEGEERTVTVRFRVVRPRAGLYFSKPSASVPDAATFAVTDHETERARYWLPTVDHPSVRPTLRFALTTRDDLTVLANGLRTGESPAGEGWKTTVYELGQPCPSYLTCFAVGRFVRFEGAPHRGITVEAYAPESFGAEAVARTFGKTSSMLEFLERRLGVPYPYPKYAQFAATGIGGAMENISLVSWDDRFVLDAALASEEQDLVDVVNVHEMAHAWFGDYVTCRDHSHAWLKESFATYAETLYLEATAGQDAMLHDLVSNQDAYFEEHDGRYRRPIVTRRFESSWDLFDAHLYPGGAVRLHMLRSVLGDAVFFDGLRDYLTRFGGAVAETDDLRRAFEARSGRSLVRFFDDWFHSPGFPELAVSTTYDLEAHEWTLRVEQKQPVQEGVPLFAFTLEVAYEVDGTLHRTSVDVDAKVATRVVPCPKAPRFVALDPDARLVARFEFDPGEPALSAALADGPTVRVRIDAARRLLKDGRDAAVDRVEAALTREPFHGARAAYVKALGGVGSERALRALLAQLDRESDPRVLPHVLRALGGVRDLRVIEAVERRILVGLAPRALEAAHEALGKQKGLAPLARLVEAAREPGFGGFAAAGALRGLGASGRTEALDPLLAALRPGGAPTRARPAAAGALATLARQLGREASTRACEALIDALRDEDRKVRSAAAEGLVTLGLADGLEAAQRHARGLPDQDRYRMERRIRAAPSAEDQERKRLETKVDALTKRVDELAAQLARRDAPAI